MILLISERFQRQKWLQLVLFGVPMDLHVPAEVLVVVQAGYPYIFVPLTTFEVFLDFCFDGLVYFDLVQLVECETHFLYGFLVAILDQDVEYFR